VKHVTISCHDFLYKRSGDKNLKTENLSFAFWKIVILALPETRRVSIMQTTGFMDPKCSTAFNFISVNTYDLGEKRVFKKE
jgi:hypothetical protein